jgi:excisionase family DNA binding protein
MASGAVLLASDDASRRLAMPRRGLSCAEAADYIGVSVTKFLEMVSDGRMPKCKQIDRRRVWDIRALDRSFDMLPGDDDADSADENRRLPQEQEIVL